MIKKIVVLGANGMLGGSLHRYFSCKDTFNVIGTVRSEFSRGLIQNLGFDNIISGIDVNEIFTVSKLIEDFKPDFVLNCVGIIKQLDDSKKPIKSIEINALLPHQLAEICNKNKSKLIHFSTDCVFSGSKGGYTESDIPDADDIYGRSKLLGEVSYGEHLTLRTSIIGHEINSNHSLVDWFLSQENKTNGYSKAIFSGLPTCYVAEVIENYILSNSNLKGLYHLSVDPIDKYTLLNIINSIYGKNITIEPKEDLVIDRSLNSTKFRKDSEFEPVSWEILIRKMHDEYKRYFNTK